MSKPTALPTQSERRPVLWCGAPLRACFAFAAVGCALLSALAVPARAEVVERVVATVNDDAIFLSELRRRAGPFLEQIAQGADGKERADRIHKLYAQLLKELVDDELIEQTARKMNVTVTSSEVEQAIDNVRKQNSLDEAHFWEAVRGQGFTEKQYRADVRKQLLRLKVTNQRVRSRINVNDETVRQEYDDRVRKARRSLRFHAQHVFFGLPQSANATDVANAIKRAQELRKTLDPKNFAAASQQYGGGDLGWLDQGDLPEDLENALAALEPGQISPPVRGPSGVHIFLLVERQTGGAQIPPFDEAKDAIYRDLLDRAMAKQQELFLAELRRSAVIETRL